MMVNDDYIIWLVVGNMNFIFPYLGNVIIPTDFTNHHFSEGLVAQPPTRHCTPCLLWGKGIP